MFPSGENGMGGATLAGDLPTQPGEGHTAENTQSSVRRGGKFYIAQKVGKGTSPSL